MLSREAGELMRTEFVSDNAKRRRWKGDNTPVTEVELRINYLAIAYIRQYFPGHNIQGEEDSDMSEESEYLWVIDPVDGTLGYSHGIPTAVFSAAVIHKGNVLAGAVYDPFMDRFYYAEQGKGAYLNDNQISVTPSHSLIHKVFGYGSGHGLYLDVGKLHNRAREADAKTINIYSALYMGALVASGDFAAAVYGGPNLYDAAAVKILVEEAGGKTSNLRGEEQSFGKPIYGLIATNGPVHDQVVEIVRECLL